MNQIKILISAVALAATPHASAQDWLDLELRLNGRQTVGAFAEVREALQSGGLTLHDSGDRRPFALAALVAPGIAVTKASELENRSEVSARDYRRRNVPVEILGTDEDRDLAILKVDWPGGKPHTPADNDEPAIGTWCAASTPRIEMPRVGLISARTRPITSRGSALGVVLAAVDDEKNTAKKGARVVQLIPNGAAEKGGIEAEDIILKIGDQEIPDRDRISEILKENRPGTVLPFQVKRGSKTLTLDITLDSPSDVFDLMDRNQQMSGETSRRKDPFPLAHQTDIPLPPSAMGGALVDIDGKLLGVTISRTDRVTTLALPVTEVMQAVAAVRGDGE